MASFQRVVAHTGQSAEMLRCSLPSEQAHLHGQSRRKHGLPCWFWVASSARYVETKPQRGRWLGLRHSARSIYAFLVGRGLEGVDFRARRLDHRSLFGKLYTQPHHTNWNCGAGAGVRVDCAGQGGERYVVIITRLWCVVCQSFAS